MANFDLERQVLRAEEAARRKEQARAAARDRKIDRKALADDLAVERGDARRDRALTKPDPFAKADAAELALRAGEQVRHRGRQVGRAAADVTIGGASRVKANVSARGTAKLAGRGAFFGLGLAYQPIRAVDKVVGKAASFWWKHKSFRAGFLLATISFAPFILPALAIVAAPRLARGITKGTVFAVNKIATRRGVDTPRFNRFAGHVNEAWTKIERPLAARTETRQQTRAVLESTPQGAGPLPERHARALGIDNEPNRSAIVKSAWAARAAEADRMPLSDVSRRKAIATAYRDLGAKLQHDRGLSKSDATKTLQAMFGADVNVAVQNNQQRLGGRAMGPAQRHDEGDVLAVLQWMNSRDNLSGMNTEGAASIAVARRCLNTGPLTARQSRTLAEAGGYSLNQRSVVETLVGELPRTRSAGMDPIRRDSLPPPPPPRPSFGRDGASRDSAGTVVSAGFGSP